MGKVETVKGSVIAILMAVAIYIILSKHYEHQEKMAEIRLRDRQTESEIAWYDLEMKEMEKSWFSKVFSGERKEYRPGMRRNQK